MDILLTKLHVHHVHLNLNYVLYLAYHLVILVEIILAQHALTEVLFVAMPLHILNVFQVIL